ncbi:MAG: PfkB family carbohydrate kinase, partial [Patescibacteria group bacterium]
MFDLISIGDVKLDAFLSLDRCQDKCDLAGKKMEFQFGEKISVDLLDQQIAGSAPNVATALARLGKKSAVVSQMGKDLTYRLAMEELPKEKVETKFIKAHPGVRSAYSAVLNLQGEKTILASYVHKPFKLPVPFPQTRWLYLSEMGNSYEQLFLQLAKLLKKRHISFGFNPGNEQIQDAKPVLFELIAFCKVLFVNVEEGQALVKNRRLGIRALAERLFALGPSEVVI